MRDQRLCRVRYHMTRRCYNTTDKSYHNYGGRGITVCDEWLENHEAFYMFAISHGYTKNLFIDRIDNNGNYCPNNIRFVTQKQNNRNKRNNTYITIGGRTQVLAGWAEESGVSRTTMGMRHKNGVTGKNLLKPVEPKQYDLGGVTATAKMWAWVIGIPVNTFRVRLKDKLSLEGMLKPYCADCVGEKGGQAKLTNQNVLDIRKLRKSGVSVKNIAKDFNMSERQIYNIVSGNKWKHLPI